MINNSDIEALVRKFVANQASEEEIELLQEYFKTPIGLKYLEQVINEHALDFDKFHLTQSSESDKSLTIKEDNSRSLLVFSRRSITRMVAATVIGIALLAGLHFYSQLFSLTLYETVAGQKITVTLPDNTIVTLNGNSSLSYRGNWKDEKVRAVDLSGEAYFRVTSNAQRPFLVNTSGISIKVLGTTFNVKSYDNDENVETTLVEGKVVIEKAAADYAVSEIIKLFPNQKATFSKNSKQIVLENVKAENEISWVNGSLIFEDEPFGEIIKDLERWYGVTIVVKDKASLQCRFNTRIEGEPLDEVLKLFSLSGDVTYHFQDDHHVSIEGSLCEQK